MKETKLPTVGDVLAPFRSPVLGGHQQIIVDGESVVIETNQQSGGQGSPIFGSDPYPGCLEFIVQKLRADGTYNPDAPLIKARIGNSSIYGVNSVRVTRKMKRTFVPA